MIERIEPVDIPGVPPLNRHTICDDNGNLLEVQYTFRPQRSRRWPFLLVGAALVAALAGLMVAL